MVYDIGCMMIYDDVWYMVYGIIWYYGYYMGVFTDMHLYYNPLVLYGTWCDYDLWHMIYGIWYMVC